MPCVSVCGDSVCGDSVCCVLRVVVETQCLASLCAVFLRDVFYDAHLRRKALRLYGGAILRAAFYDAHLRRKALRLYGGRFYVMCFTMPILRRKALRLYGGRFYVLRFYDAHLRRKALRLYIANQNHPYKIAVAKSPIRYFARTTNEPPPR